MQSKAVSAHAGVALPNPGIIIDDGINSALLAAMRLWEKETQKARDAEEERNSRLRQLMN
jgi:hypothetical protein